MIKRKAHPGAMGDGSRLRWSGSTGNDQGPGEERLGCTLAPPEGLRPGLCLVAVRVACQLFYVAFIKL